MTENTMQTEGRFETAHASKYLQQLCKHFAHKVEVTYDAQSGRVVFPMGTAALAATPEALVVSISAGSDEAIAQGRSVIDSHLVRFAFRENFEAMSWR